MTPERLARRIASKSPFVYPGVCYFCDTFAKIVRKGGQPFERSEYGYEIDTHDFVYAHDNHKANCLWIEANMLLGRSV